MWIKSGCPFCVKAREALLVNQISHSVYVMDDSLEELDEIQKTWTHTTVPVVVLKENSDESLIGGWTELEKWLDERQSTD